MQDEINGSPPHPELTMGNDSGANGLQRSPLSLAVVTQSAERGDHFHANDCVAQHSSNTLLPYCSFNHLRRRDERMAKIQFDLPDEKLAELEALRREAQLETRKDLFNTALTLLEWAIEEVKAGRAIASVDEDNKRYREIVMPALRAVAPPKNGSRTKGQ